MPFVEDRAARNPATASDAIPLAARLTDLRGPVRATHQSAPTARRRPTPRPWTRPRVTVTKDCDGTQTRQASAGRKVKVLGA
ncbi:hypothetical protein GCM10010170_068620 [Dactylosporangium salmoneum]|uniref:Uncharacterized protein n=1 Tax=Dactylosporangium salmoneum TaxID=53361 RepID=A0ABP5U6S1_9ACTN